MALNTECPKCGLQLFVDPSLRGRRIRCKGCGEAYVVRGDARSQGNGGYRSRQDEDEYNDRGRRQSSGSQTGVIIGVCIGGAVLLIGIVITMVLVIVQPWKKEEPPAVAIENPFPFGNNRPIDPPQPAANPFKPIDPPVNPPFNPVNPPVDPPRADEIADPISRAIAQLKSDDVFGQDGACKSLAKMTVDAKRRPEVVEAVKHMIDARAGLSPRREGVRALAMWGTADEVPYLLTLLDDGDGGVQEAAIVALGKKKDARAADALALRLSNGGQRGAASQALKEIGPAAETVVRQQLNHGDNGVRIEAIKVLKVIGTAASQKELVELANDDDHGIAQAAREALPANLRPPIWGPKQSITLNVHVADYQAWPAIEAKIKALADAPKPKCKSSRSGEYMWVTLAPVNVDPDTFARKIKFGSIVAVHTNQRLIYVESGR